MIPKKIGRYEIRAKLGHGGMAIVYRGYDPRFKREVAVKVLPREFLDTPVIRARFEHEAELVAGLEHPAIVPVYDFGDEDGQPYLVMRLMPGGTLAARLATGPLSLTETASIFSRLAPALERAHRQGVIHRDLKPANILFDDEGNPYLSDFGIAKMTEGSATLTGSGLVGTPAYMSPEQARGEKHIDGRSDLYALGIIVFEMLTGKLPFEADTPMGLVMKHLTEPTPNILDSNPNLPPPCNALIQKALAKDRDDRFQTACDLANNLASIAASKPPQPRRPHPPQIARVTPGDLRPTQAEPEAITRRELSHQQFTTPAFWFVGALGLIFGIAFCSLGTSFGGRLSGAIQAAFTSATPTHVQVTTSPRTATTRPSNTPTRTATSTAAANNTATSTATPTPTETLTLTRQPTRAPTNTVIPFTAAPTPTSVPPTPSLALPPVLPGGWSARTCFVGTGVADRDDICICNSDASSCINLTNHPADDNYPDLSPDRTRIVFQSSRNGYGNEEIYLINVDGTGLTRLTNSAGFDVYPKWSADGTQIYFDSTRSGNEWHYFVMNADGSNQQLIP